MIVQSNLHEDSATLEVAVSWWVATECGGDDVGTRLLGRRKSRCEDDMKVDRKEVSCGNVWLIEVA